MIVLRDPRYRFLLPAFACVLSGLAYRENKKRKERKANENQLEDHGHSSGSGHMDDKPAADYEFPFERWRKLHADGEGI